MPQIPSQRGAGGARQEAGGAGDAREGPQGAGPAWKAGMQALQPQVAAQAGREQITAVADPAQDGVGQDGLQ